MTAQQIEAKCAFLFLEGSKKRENFSFESSLICRLPKKPAETRMGKGKGNVELWVAVVKREALSAKFQNR